MRYPLHWPLSEQKITAHSAGLRLRIIFVQAVKGLIYGDARCVHGQSGKVGAEQSCTGKERKNLSAVNIAFAFHKTAEDCDQLEWYC